MSAPIYELAAVQEDPLAEAVLAILNTDQPVRETVQADTRRHVQWMSRSPENVSSRLWLSFARPITDATPGEIETRALAALASLIPLHLSNIEATATQVRYDAINLALVLTRVSGEITEMSVTLEQGVPGA